MTFAELFQPVRPQVTATRPLRNMRNIEILTLTSRENVCLEVSGHILSPIGKESEVECSACSATSLVPLYAPFAEGRRYREAGAVEVQTRLDLYREDPAGPWIRRHGVLITAAHQR